MDRIFITGATGVLGKRVVKLLLETGYEITGLSRSPDNTNLLTELGAEPKPANLFSSDELINATAKSDVILHFATAIPSETIPKKPMHWAMNDRIRTVGTKALLKAAKANKINCFITQSITRIYGDKSGEEVNSTTPAGNNLPFMLKSAVEMERLVSEAKHVDYLTLRFGQFYSADSVTTRQMIEGIRQRKLPIIGSGDYYWNYIHSDDAARAVLYAIRNVSRLKNQALNFTDFEPIRAKAALNELADSTSSKPPYRIPGFLARLVLSNELYKTITASFKVIQDEQIKDWQPVYRNFNEGMNQIITAQGNK